MGYKSLEECLLDLEQHGQLVRIKQEVDPYLQMASIHLRVHQLQGPAILFENVKGTKFRCVSNLFGTLQRSKFIFRHQLNAVKQLINLKNNPLQLIKNPLKNIPLIKTAWYSLPKKINNAPILKNTCQISDLPPIVNWPMDGGPFITLPAVYTEDCEFPGVLHSNIGMYRIQLSGNNYIRNKEVGLHYQLHRGIGVHQTKTNAANIPLKVSIFIGGPPSLTFSAVMPLPEGMPEVTFAGALGGRRFRYIKQNNYTVAADADFVITGYVKPNNNKPEGPFGDHLGYYSLTHPFPVLQVEKVYHKPNAIWPFTVVGRPPQEDTSFGLLIHEITGNVLTKEIPGLKELNAVDAAGVHPLLLAIGQERYTPYLQTVKPMELLTIANHILGKGQLSLAKYLFIISDEDKSVSTFNPINFFTWLFERIDFENDLHFYTKTSIDTLDYSGDELNNGSKVVLAACGSIKRTLIKQSIEFTNLPPSFEGAKLCLPGVLAFKAPTYKNAEIAHKQINDFKNCIKDYPLINQIALIVLVDNPNFVAENLNNWLWVTFTRSNPANDIYGVNEYYNNKHWSCKGPLIIDARTKPHHAPELQLDPQTEAKTDQLFNKGGELYNWFNKK